MARQFERSRNITSCSNKKRDFPFAFVPERVAQRFVIVERDHMLFAQCERRHAIMLVVRTQGKSVGNPRSEQCF